MQRRPVVVAMLAVLAVCLAVHPTPSSSQGSSDGVAAAIHRIEVVVENGKVRARAEDGAWLDVPDHPATRVNWIRQESIVWYCKTNDFEVKMNRGNPFYRDFPAASVSGSRVVSSGPARPGPYNGREFKFSVVVPGVGELDPHVIVEP